MGRAPWVGLVALLAVLVAGCGSTPAPKFAPPPSSAVPSGADTTSAADPLPPVMPELAKEHTVAGAKAFVEYYWAVANYAQEQLDVAPLKALADEHCSGCEGGADFISGVAQRHGHIRGGATKLVGLKAVVSPAVDGTTWMEATYWVTAGPQFIDLPGKRNDVRYSGGRRSAHMALRPTKNGWLVDLLDIGA